MYSYNLTAFDDINESSAYFLGLLYADGNLSDKGRVCLNLSNKDCELLIKFKDFLKTSKPIYYNAKTNSNTFAFQSKVLSNKLVELGMTPRKSLTLKFPKCIPPNYMRDFIRGYFDGDGCVSLTESLRSSSLRIHLVGTYEILYGIQSILIKECKINPTTIGNISKGKNTYQLEIRTKKGVEEVRKYLYDNATIYLVRKKNIFFSDVTIKKQHNTTSKYLNICFNKQKQCWRATYRLGGIRKEKSGFLTEAEAHSFLLGLKS